MQPSERLHHRSENEAQQDRERDGHENLATEVKRSNNGADNDYGVGRSRASSQIGAEDRRTGLARLGFITF